MFYSIAEALALGISPGVFPGLPEEKVLIELAKEFSRVEKFNRDKKKMVLIND